MEDGRSFNLPRGSGLHEESSARSLHEGSLSVPEPIAEEETRDMRRSHPTFLIRQEDHPAFLIWQVDLGRAKQRRERRASTEARLDLVGGIGDCDLIPNNGIGIGIRRQGAQCYHI